MTAQPGPAARESLATRAGRAFTAYRDGDPQRLRDLVELLTPVLWHTARAQGADRATCEDAVQTAWLQLVDHAESIGEPVAVLGWLVTVVKREVWRLSRGSRREVRVEEPPERPETADDPETMSILGERQRVLWAHFGALPRRCQELLRVVAFADRPDYSAVAVALGMPVGSIGPTRGRCLGKLRALLGSDPRWAV